MLPRCSLPGTGGRSYSKAILFAGIFLAELPGSHLACVDMNKIGGSIIAHPAKLEGHCTVPNKAGVLPAQADIHSHALHVQAPFRDPSAPAAQFVVRCRRSITGNNLIGSVAAHLLLHFPKNIEQGRINRVGLRRTKIPEIGIDSFQGDRVICPGVRIGDGQVFVCMGMIELQCSGVVLSGDSGKSPGRCGLSQNKPDSGLDS